MLTLEGANKPFLVVPTVPTCPDSCAGAASGVRDDRLRLLLQRTGAACAPVLLLLTQRPSWNTSAYDMFRCRTSSVWLSMYSIGYFYLILTFQLLEKQ